MPEDISANELTELGIVPVSVALLRSCIPTISHWSSQCLTKLHEARYVLCDPYYCSAHFKNGDEWIQPMIALDWLLERVTRLSKELAKPHLENPWLILDEGATLAASFMRNTLDRADLDAAAAGEIPEIEVGSDFHLKNIGRSLAYSVKHAPALTLWYRGQNREYLMPDAQSVVSRGFLLHRQFRDSSLIPSAYRGIDAAYADMARLEKFLKEIMLWYDVADEVLGPDYQVVRPGEAYFEREARPSAKMSSTTIVYDMNGDPEEFYTKHCEFE
jgi:hypothetical protein